MVEIIVTALICATVLAAIFMLQHKGLPVVHIKREEVQPNTQIVQLSDLVPTITENPTEEPTPKEQKEQALTDPMSAIAAFLRGDEDIGI